MRHGVVGRDPDAGGDDGRVIIGTNVRRRGNRVGVAPDVVVGLVHDTVRRLGRRVRAERCGARAVG